MSPVPPCSNTESTHLKSAYILCAAPYAMKPAIQENVAFHSTMLSPLRMTLRFLPSNRPMEWSLSAIAAVTVLL